MCEIPPGWLLSYGGGTMTIVIERVKWAKVPRSTDTREKMVKSAAALLREAGVAAPGSRAVVAPPAPPRGSIAPHSPGGKRQLVSEAVRGAGGLSSRAMRTKASPPAEIV